MTTGYAAALVTLFSWTISVFISLKLSRLIPPGLLNKSTLFFSTLILGLIVCIIDKISPWHLFLLPGSSQWFLLGLSGILGKAIGDYCGFVCLRIMGPGRRSMIATLTPGFIWVFALLLLDEHINIIGITGMMVTVVSLFLILSLQSEKEEVLRENFGKFSYGITMGVLGAVLTAIAFILAKKALTGPVEKISEFHATWIRIFSAFIFIWVADILTNKNNQFISEIVKVKGKLPLLLLNILFGAVIGLSSSLIAITRMPTAEAYTIFSLTPMLVIIISAVWYKRSVPMLIWLLSVLAIAGTLLLVWREKLAGWHF